MRRLAITFIALFICTIFAIWCIPVSLPQAPYSTVIFSNDSTLLGASVATDGQWRFPAPKGIPDPLRDAILAFEDQYFYLHPGVNPLAVVRALVQNQQAGKKVSGASTITMQVARLIENKPRTWRQKFIEAWLAIRLELQYSKADILLLYTTHAPYGGNVVGVEAASWRYFERPLEELSWAEYALLAVLPNQPSALFPGKSEIKLKNKRDRLLFRLYSKGVIDEFSYQMAIDEPLPTSRHALPSEAFHLLHSLKMQQPGTRLYTTINKSLQKRTSQAVKSWHDVIVGNGVENIAAMIVSLSTGSVVAYVGNVDNQQVDGHEIDMLQRPRSTGSTLKPLLFAMAVENGFVLPETILPDLPTYFAGFTPKNFHHGYDGMVAAHHALSRSLNIPFVHLLKTYGYQQFYQDLRHFGLTKMHPDPDHYGLSMILGGAEVSPWQLSQSYQTLYDVAGSLPSRQIHVLKEKSENLVKPNLSAQAAWLTLKAMTDLVRPGDDQHWDQFESSQLIAWKTGTSYGFKDAWAIGTNGNYLVCVWVGNADNEGRAGMTGTTMAAPLLLQLMHMTSSDDTWLTKLKPAFEQKVICVNSGYPASAYCNQVKKAYITNHTERMGLCPYHQVIYLDKEKKYRVNSSCYTVKEMIQDTLFVLPPAEALYFQKRNPNYRVLPKMKSGCANTQNTSISMIYPTPGSQVIIPVGAHGQEKVILKASHLSANTALYWHMNQAFIGKTTDIHEMPVTLPAGSYLLTLIDTEGNQLSQTITIK